MKHLSMFSQPQDFEDILNDGKWDFWDREFPPDMKSLYRGGGSVDLYPEEIETLRGLEFKWLSEIRDDRDIHLFDKIEPDDVKQGVLGDCYFLSALAALAEYPERIEKLFLEGSLQNEKWISACQLYINGV